MGVIRSVKMLQDNHDAVLLCGGSEQPRKVDCKGIELGGVHYAMPYLVLQNRINGGEDVSHMQPISAAGKHVVVIGGGDTASDCIGTAFRQGACAVSQMDIRPKPPIKENKLENWPFWAIKLRTSTSQAEGAVRYFSTASLEIIGDKNGQAAYVKCAEVDENRVPIKGTEFKVKADLVLIAIGFAHPIYEGLIEESGVKLDKRGNILANMQNYRTSVKGLYAAGDMRRGQSLVVWAIKEGRQAARAIDLDLMGRTDLPL